MAAPIKPSASNTIVPEEPARIVRARLDLPDDFNDGDYVVLKFILDRNLSPLEYRVIDEQRPDGWQVSDLNISRSMTVSFAQVPQDGLTQVQSVLDQVHARAVSNERAADNARSNLQWLINDWGLED